MSALEHETVREVVRRAWFESYPGTDAAHEEGGFVLRDDIGNLSVERWPRGDQNQILVPPHPQGRRGELEVIATFHTHPNPDDEFQQEPSQTDIRAVRDDVDLAGFRYEGEYVIAAEFVYRIAKNGEIEVVGETRFVLNTP